MTTLPPSHDGIILPAKRPSRYRWSCGCGRRGFKTYASADAAEAAWGRHALRVKR